MMGKEDKTKKDQHKMQDIEIKKRLLRIKHKILVMSGKGGVGKSSVATYLSVSLARKGYKVGLMDVDLHGPSIPRMLGLKGNLRESTGSGKARPISYLPNMEVISIESLLGENKDAATIWRGPLKIGVIRQFVSDLEWDDLDYLVIDSPPGTGDEPLTVAQTIPDALALIVTTPQEVSLADVRKSINFCRQVNMEILGLVENMSGLLCPHCGKPIDLFKTQGGMLTAKEEGLNLLGTLPLEPQVVMNGDAGSMAILDDATLPITEEFNKLVDRIVQLTKDKKTLSSKTRSEFPVINKDDGKSKMLAVPVSDGKLSSHFGHCEQFAFIETMNGKIVKTEMRNPPPHEPGVLPQWLHDQGANVAIVGGMGETAQRLLRENGIEVIIGAPMDSPESLANQYLNNTLIQGENRCDH
ncbi:dinitrogenase iron-molybdenum cofactor [delta proteobacterium NaphS2]|nr:dinitrogenase iron-molybdenum cofactor [delta proteobacterium NaphS2]